MNYLRKFKGFWFLLLILVSYIILLLTFPDKTKHALQISSNIFKMVIPIIVLIIFFTTLINLFVSTKLIKRYLGKKSGLKGLILAIVAGIISHGAIYLWYNLLKDLKKKGMGNGLIAVFLYNRAIKIPLIPIMTHYFGLKFVIILTFYTIISSLILGFLMNLQESLTPKNSISLIL